MAWCDGAGVARAERIDRSRESVCTWLFRVVLLDMMLSVAAGLDSVTGGSCSWLLLPRL
jgi:hypothetical protein